MYGSSFFFVEPQMNVDLPEEVFLAVNPKGVLIINPDSKAVSGAGRGGGGGGASARAPGSAWPWGGLL